MGPRDHMADPLLDQRGPTLGAAGGDEGRGPMQRRAGRGVGGKDGKEEEGVGGGTGGSEAPTPFLPSFLPGLFWAPQTLTTRVGETPNPCVQGLGPRRRPGVRRGGKNR